MRRIGVWLIVIGAINWVIPMITKSRDHLLYAWMGEARDYVAGALIVAGAVMVVMGGRKKPPTGTV